MTKVEFLAQVRAERLIAVVRADLGAELVECARALAGGGIHCIEIAMTTPGAIDTLKHASESLPEFRFGLGTVLDVETARLGILAGATFIVTPAPRPEVITLCRRYHVPVISGAFTREDIIAAHKSGADAVKVFPGEQFGPAYVRTLKESFGDIALLPIGGVTPDTIAEFLRAGAMAAFSGNSLVEEETVKLGDWAKVTERAQQFTRAIATLD